MLSFLRKHQYGFMLVIAIVVIIAFTFFYDQNDRRGLSRTEDVFSVYDKDYSLADLERYQYTWSLARELGLFDLMGSLYGDRLDQSPQDFIYNLIILRKESDKLGLRASQKEIEAKIRTLYPFLRNTGTFEQAEFDNLKANLGSLGFTTEDLYNLVGDAVVLDKLKELLGANFVPSSTEIDAAYDAKNARVSAYRVDFKADKYALNVEVSDEEVAKYYEDNKAKFRSEPKRGVEYIHFTQPKFDEPTPNALPSDLTPPVPTPEEAAPAEAAPEEEAALEEAAAPSSCQGGTEDAEPDAAATDAAADATDETTVAPATDTGALSIPAGAPADALDASAQLIDITAQDPPTPTIPPAPVGPTPEERAATMRNYNTFMDKFITDASKPGADFKALAEASAATVSSEKFGASYGTFEPFSQSDPPEALKAEGGLLRALFTHPMSKAISTPVRVQDGFYIFRVTAEEAPRDLSLEEASEQIRETLTKEKQAEAVKKAAEEAREKLVAELKGGAKFADAAATIGVEAMRIPTFTATEPPKDTPDFASDLQPLIADTAAGQISEPDVNGENAVLVYVASRVVPEDPDIESKKKEIATELEGTQFSSDGYDSLMFKAWLNEARKKANPQPDDLRLGRPVM